MGGKQAVYFFGNGRAEGKGSMKEQLGGKGAGLAEMTNLGLPVPPGFTITTEECIRFYNEGSVLRPDLQKDVLAALGRVEEILGRRFGDPQNPLLVSVRSGARASMPGMMDTILNLGLNDATVRGLVQLTGNPRFGWDSYRRFVQMFGSVVLGVPHHDFEHILHGVKEERRVKLDTDLNAEDLQRLVGSYKAHVLDKTGQPFPEDPHAQLWAAITSVFGSWFNDRAQAYRRMHRIPDDWGTAANVQSMVFGNMGDDSATGVAFTRDPATGENRFFGEYLTNAQGEDVVAGIRTPHPLGKSQKEAGEDLPSLEEEMPEIYRQLQDIRTKLEQHYHDMLDLEFTVERARLWMLQTRTGKRTGFAAVRIAVEMVDEGLITAEEALLRVEPDSLNQLLQPIFDPEAKRKAIKEGRLLGKGINAGPGAATGKIALHSADAEKLASTGDAVVLVRRETSPDDIRGMAASKGILTAFGGATSHAALVSRQMGKVCVVGCSALSIDYDRETITVGSRVLRAGDSISIDGFTGEVLAGSVATRSSEVIDVVVDRRLNAEDSEVYQRFARLMTWADEKRTLRVRTNADSPEQARLAIAFGAEGIGLCRTEHMFFGEDRLPWVRKMILAANETERRAALATLKPMQRADFEGIFEAMDGLPVTVRLLDPPLHEFVPHSRDDAEALARELGMDPEHVWRRCQALQEMNPMLGHRGCRLGITYPEIYEMQAEAIFEAALAVHRRGKRPVPEVMLPLIGITEEYRRLQALVLRAAEKVLGADAGAVPFLVGTMIEVPRAALIADRIAEQAQFFSFGTNDLTQLVFGYSRDDSGSFLPKYVEDGILSFDPFQSLDLEGVGQMVRLATERGRSTRPDLKVGICGEHGGDPASVEFCHRVGLNYVSCSPYRIPIARLAAAAAAVRKS